MHCTIGKQPLVAHTFHHLTHNNKTKSTQFFIIVIQKAPCFGCTRQPTSEI